MTRNEDELEGTQPHPMSLPRDRVGDGWANEGQWVAVNRWARRYRREHRHQDAWAQFDQAEIEDENERDRRR